MPDNQRLAVIPTSLNESKEHVTQRLRFEIERGEHKVGTQLKEEELAQKFQISRASIREALKLLEAEGMVQHQQNKGFFIPDLSLEDIKNTYDARIALEGAVVRHFTIEATPTEIEHLRKAIEDFRAAALAYTDHPEVPSCFDELFAAKNNVYQHLLTGSRNPVLSTLLRSLRSRIWQLRRGTLSEPGRGLQTYDELLVIYQAIKDQKPGAAERASRRHVELAAKVAYNQRRQAAGSDERYH